MGCAYRENGAVFPNAGPTDFRKWCRTVLDEIIRLLAIFPQMPPKGEWNVWNLTAVLNYRIENSMSTFVCAGRNEKSLLLRGLVPNCTYSLFMAVVDSDLCTGDALKFFSKLEWVAVGLLNTMEQRSMPTGESTAFPQKLLSKAKTDFLYLRYLKDIFPEWKIAPFASQPPPPPPSSTLKKKKWRRIQVWYSCSFFSFHFAASSSSKSGNSLN